MINRFPKAAFLLTVGLSAFGAFAQADEAAPAPTNHLNPIHLDPSLSEVIKKGDPIPFKPFKLVDPSTGHGDESKATPVKPDTVFTLPNGKQTKAGDYYNWLNKFEQYVTPHGYTLRSKSQAPVNFSHVRIDTDTFELQRQKTLSAHDTTHPLVRPIFSDVQALHGVADKLNPALLKDVDKAVKTHAAQSERPRTYHASKSWSDSWGAGSTLSAYVDSNMTTDGTHDKVSSSASAAIGASLFGDRLDIIRAQANYAAPKKGNLTGDNSLYFLGIKIFNYGYDSANSVAYTNNDGWSTGLDESTSIYFTVGFIPMSATIGAHGSIGMDYVMDLLPLSAATNIVPNVESDVYIEVGIDLIIAGAGAGADLVLINDMFTASGVLKISNDKEGKDPYYSSRFVAMDFLTTLSGQVYVYAYIYVPAWALPPWQKEQWNYTLFQWGGITTNGLLFDQLAQQNLF